MGFIIGLHRALFMTRMGAGFRLLGRVCLEGLNWG